MRNQNIKCFVDLSLFSLETREFGFMLPHELTLGKNFELTTHKTAFLVKKYG